MRFLTRNQRKYPILRARWRVKKHGDPIFYCIFLMFISWTLIRPSFQKSLIVEQFQGILSEMAASI